MSDFEEYIKVNYPRDYERQKRIYPDQSVEELYSEDYKMWQHQQAIIDQINSVLEERTKEWLQAIECGTYFENIAKPLKEENDRLKAQLNNMEVCYIGVKKELEDAIYLKDEHRKRRCQLAKQLTQKSLRLTEAEFEYKRIKRLQAKDCLQIMRLTARNEKLSDEVKALRGAND